MSETTVASPVPRRQPPVEALERLWQEGQQPDPFAFLEASGPCSPAEIAAVLALDQWQRWHAGQPVAAEEYLRRCPVLENDPTTALELVYGEFLVREELNEKPTAEEYFQRFPQYEARLREQFQLHNALGQDASRASAATLATLPPRNAANRALGAGPPSPPPRGSFPTIPGYEVLGELGRGGMGVVYKARQVTLDRLVALKMIRAGSGAEPAELARFRTEAEAVARLQHPNIVQIYEVGEVDGRPFFSLELVAGGSLAEQIKNAPLAPAQAARLLETLARAMDSAHRAGIIHRDLKPANVLLAADGTPKITDFGLAKRLDIDIGQTQTGMVLGTPSYMSPEQAQGKTHEIGPAADVYALGAVLYDVLTGRPPFMGSTPMNTLFQVLGEEPVPPSRLQPRLPRDLETICLKCLHKEAGRRYASALDLSEDLRRFQADESILARPAGAAERTIKWARRRPAAAAFVAVCVLAAAALATLGVSLINARLQAAEGRAQLAEKELREERRLESQRTEAQRLFLAGQAAFRAGDWPGAQLLLEKARTTIGGQVSLTGLQKQVTDLLAQTRARLAAAAAREKARTALTDFKGVCEKALFASAQVTGLDLTENVRKTREAAAAALKLFGVTDAPGTPLVLNGLHFSADEQERIRAQCYELLLLHAEAVARVLPGEAQQRQADRALRLLDQAAQLAPATRAYHLRRANYLEQKGEAVAAARERAQAAAVAPAGALDYFLLADERYQRQDLNGALVNLEQALRKEPDHFWAQFLMGVCYLKSRRPAEAKFCFRTCLGYNSDFVWLYLLRGHAEGELGAAALANTRLSVKERRQQAEFHFGEAESDFLRAARLPGNNPDADYVLFINRGVLRIHEGKFETAIADLLRARPLKPRQYEVYLNLAEAFRRQGKLTEAVQQLDRAIDLEKKEDKRAPLYWERARLHLEPGHKDRKAALADLDRAIALEPAGSRSPYLALVHTERGRLLAWSGRHGEAQQSYEAALRIRPDDPTALRLRAHALMQLRRYKEVVACLDRYLQTAAPQSARAPREPKQVADAYRRRGLAQGKLGNLKAALDDYSLALTLDPNSATYAFRGWVLLVNDAPKLALPDFAKAVALDRENGDAFNGRGYAQVFFNRYSEAVADAEEALRLGPKETRHLYNAARIYAQASARVEIVLGQRDRGARTLNQKYQDRALELIEQALGLLGGEDERERFWQSSIQGDRALYPLHRHYRFIKLREKYDKKGPAARQ